MFNLIIIPPIAKSLGRIKLPVFSTIKPRNILYPLLFRNYVTPELYIILKTASKSLEKENIKITYLDANFPFYNGFPLLPHRSHNDGKKIDLSFIYKNANNSPTNKKPTLSGYGHLCKKQQYNGIVMFKKRILAV